MLLSKLLQDVCSIPSQADRDILAITLDSRLVKKSSLFLALKGAHLDGSQYIQDAISRGAAAILVDAEFENSKTESGIPIIPVHQLKKNIGILASRFYDHPSKKLRMIGITGTSGKTSCSHFFAQSLQALNIPCGIIGTLGSGFYGELGTAGLTTPDPITLQSTLNDFVAKGAKAIAMEVSSHSIDQGRINGIEFDIGIFTNLSQDHLDYHGDMESYAAVKRRFMAELPVKNIIINADDAYGEKWIKELSSQKTVFAYCTKKPENIANVQWVYADKIEATLHGTQAVIKSPWGEAEISIPLVGQFNLSNSLSVFTALCVYGVPFADAVKMLSELKTVPGRMQTLGGNNHPLVVVDYAHKPDALEKVLQALRGHTSGKLWCVFGCGGERDRGKRPLMAKIAESLADQVIVTNDNPRHENPEDIAAEIMKGFTHPERVSVLLDRAKAIENSMQNAKAGDCVLIAGKGAERYQQVGDVKLPFDDVEKVKEYLRLHI